MKKSRKTEEMEKKGEIICPQCKDPINKVINVHGTNRYFHYRENNSPCPIKANLVTPELEIIKKGNKSKTELKEKRKISKTEKSEELPSSRLPLSDEIKKKGGIQEMEILPQARSSYEILEEILRSFYANEKIIQLLIKKCARRDLTPDEVQFNLEQLGVRSKEAEWIADEYDDAIIDEERKRVETKKPRPRRRDVIREDEGRPYRGRFQERDSEAYPMKKFNREESRISSPYSNAPAPLSKEDIREMIEEAIMKRDKDEKITNLSNSIKNLEITLKEEIQKMRSEIPSDSVIKEKAREVTGNGKDEINEGEYEKVLKQEIEDLKEEREKVKEENKEKTNELKEDFKEKEKDFKDKIEALEKNMKSNHEQHSNTHNEDAWRYKSDITGKIMDGATAMTKDILDKAPIRKGMNIWVRGAEEEEKEREKSNYIEPKLIPPELPDEYTADE